MPVVHFYIPDHIPMSKVTGLADAVHRALVETLAVPETDRFHVIHRLSADCLLMDPTFPDVQRSADACIIQVDYIEGRSLAQKLAFYEQAVAAAVEIGFQADDITLSVMENRKEDWSPGGGRCFASANGE